MKYIYLILIIFLTNILLSQKVLELDAQQTYSNSINTISGILKTISVDKDLISLSQVYDGAAGKCLYSFIKTDTAFNILWQKFYDYSNSYAFQATDFIKDTTSLYSIGCLFQDTINEYDWFLSKHNTVGDTIFVKTYIDTASMRPIKILKTGINELSIMLLEKHDYQTSLYSRTVLIKTDTNGVLISQHYTPLHLKGPQSLLFNAVLNKYYVMGSYRTSPGATYNVKYFIENYDSNFNLLSNHYMYSGTINESFFDATLSNNRIYYTASWQTVVPPNPSQVSQIRFNMIDPENNTNFPLHHTNVGPYDLYDVIYTSNIIKLSNNLFSYIIHEPGTRNTLVFADTTTQTICSSYVLQSYYYDYSIYSHTNINNSIYAGGTVEDTTSSPYKSFLVKTKNYKTFLIDSCSYIITNLNTNKPEQLVSVFPNPATNFVMIDTKEFPNLNYEAYNATGAKVLSGIVNKYFNMIPIESLGVGIYIFKFYNNTSSFQVKIIKQSER